jgi:PilZ domain
VLPGDQRATPRRESSGRAFWSNGRTEGSCTLRNISMGGALIERPDMLLTIGQQLELTLDLGSGQTPAVQATVVRMNNGAVAFRFGRVTQAFLDALAAAAVESGRS